MSEINKNELKNLTDEVRSLNEKVDGDLKKLDAIDLKKFENIQAEMDKIEDVNQKLSLQVQEEKAKREELEEKFTELEKNASAPQNVGPASETELKAQVQAMETLIVKGEHALTEMELKYLRTDSNVEGGYLVGEEYERTIIKDITEESASVIRRPGS